ncbi:hypothetical protein Fmac_010233 [Flemingia macrophylla]|uniref:Uncharacterized protein n=1 Tax=Flemingia macrophylla TaxID=520843 RepID=A0ABD1N2P4_9FABA
MELDIAKMEFDFKGTSVICRRGSPLILADLKKVSVSKARAIIVLGSLLKMGMLIRVMPVL